MPPDADPAPPTVETVWHTARTAFARYDYAATAAACARVLELAPAHEEAARLKGHAEEKQQQLAAALQLANGYFNKGQYELALVHFNTVVGLCPTDEAIRRKQEMAKLLAGQDLTAYTPKPVRRMTAKWADEVVPSPVSTAVMAGLILVGVTYLFYYAYDRRVRHQRTAEELFRQVEQRLAMEEYLSGQSQESYNQLTTIYGDTQFAKNAAEILEQTRAKKLAETPRLLDQAETYLAEDQPTLALELARDVLQWDPSNARAQEMASRADEAVKHWEDRLLRQALAGGVRRQPGKPAAAVPAATAAPSAAVSSTTAGTMLATASVEELLLQSDDRLAPTVEKLVRRGQDRLNAGDYAAAAFLWEKALAQHGRPHQVLERLVHKARLLDARAQRRFEEACTRAVALEEAQRWPEALVVYREAQAYRPDDEEVRGKIAAIAARLALPSEEAVAPAPEPRPALAQPPTRRQAQAERWRKQAALHEQADQWPEAVKAYRKALAAAPDPALRAQLHLVQLIAVEERRRAKPGSAPDAGRDLVLAEAYLGRGKPAQARQLLQALLLSVSRQQKGRQAVLHALIGRAYVDEKADREAIAAYRQSIRQAPVWYVQHSLAQALWRNGQYLEAVRLWEQALQQTPKQADIIAALAVSYMLMDLPAQAQALLEPLKAWKIRELHATQQYPMTVRPDYWLGTVTSRDLLAEVCEHIAQAWVLLDQPLESLRWRQLAQAERAAEEAAYYRHLPPPRPWWRFWSR